MSYWSCPGESGGHGELPCDGVVGQRIKSWRAGVDVKDSFICVLKDFCFTLDSPEKFFFLKEWFCYEPGVKCA